MEDEIKIGIIKDFLQKIFTQVKLNGVDTLYDLKDIIGKVAWDEAGLDYSEYEDGIISECKTPKKTEHIKSFQLFVESFDSETIMSLDNIRAGDYVDFGEFGNMYIIKETADGYVVTDIVSDRFNPKAEGITIEKDKAVKIIDTAQNY